MDTPTPYPDLNTVLAELTQGVRSSLGKNFVGAYLQGSFAIGDFDEHSDVDFIIVVGEELSEREVEALQTMHGRLYGLECAWAQHLEGSYFPWAMLKDYTQAGMPLWYLDHGSRSLIRSNHCNTVVVRWTLREHGVTLAGPNLVSMIEPIPYAALRQEILKTIRDWGREIVNVPERYNNRFYQGFIVLSYCRMLRDLCTGETGSKRAGAEWAKATLDPCWAGLIDRAWKCRPDPALSVRQPADAQDFRLTLEFVRYIIRAAEQYAEDKQWVGSSGSERAKGERDAC